MVKARTSKPGRVPPDLADAMNPHGGATGGRADGSPALQPTGLLEAALDPANLNRAWRRVKANRGAPGVDGLSIDDFPARMRSQWPEIKQALLGGTYCPSPVRRVDELLWDLGGLRYLAGTGYLATTSYSNVLLGDVETSLDAYSESQEAGCPDQASGRFGPQQPGPMEMRPAAGVRHVERMVGRTRSSVFSG